MSTPTSREAIEKLLYEKVTSYQAVNYEELTDALLALQDGGGSK